MSTIVELINERAAKIMEEGGTTEKVINVKAISKADAIEMAIEQLVKEGLIKTPTMTPSERREKLAKVRFKTGVFTPKPKPTPEPEPTPETEPKAVQPKTESKPRKKATELTTADLYKFAGEDPLRPIMNGVHYADGHAEATDARILIRVPFSYPADYEGKTISKLSNEIEGEYPNTASVIPDISEENGYKPYKFNAETILQNSKDLLVLQKYFKGSVNIKIGDVYFNAEYMKTVADLCVKHNADTIYLKENDRAALIPILDGIILVMPIRNGEDCEFYISQNRLYKGTYYTTLHGSAPKEYLKEYLKEENEKLLKAQHNDNEKDYKKAKSEIKKINDCLEVLAKYQVRTAPKKRTGAVAAARPEKSRLQNLKLVRVPKATEEEQKRFQRRERLAAIRAKRGAEAKQSSPKGKTLKLAGKKKPTDVDIDFLPANLRGKKIPTGGDYDDFAKKAMNEYKGDFYMFIQEYTRTPYWNTFQQDHPEEYKDLLEILRLVSAKKKGAEIDSKGQVITNEADINGVRIRENDWVRVSGSWSEAENRLYRVEPLREWELESQLKQFKLQPIKQDGTDAKAMWVEWPMWNSQHSKLEDRKAYHEHNKKNLKIEIVDKKPKEIKSTPRYTATKDGIYLPDRTYIKVFFDGGEKDGDPIQVYASSYGSQLHFLATKDDKVHNETDYYTDYHDTDSIKVTKTNPLYDVVRIGALKRIVESRSWNAKREMDDAKREEKRMQEKFDISKSPQDSLNLLNATKKAKAAEKAYEDKLKEFDGLKKEIARLERKVKGGEEKTSDTKSTDDKTSWDGNDLKLILKHEKLKNPLNLYITPSTIKNKTIYYLDIYSKYGENGLGINIVMNRIIDSVKHTQEIVLRKNYKPIRYRIEAHHLDKKQMSEILDDLLDVFKNLNIEISSDNPKPVSEKTLKRREKLAAIRAKYGITPVQPSPKGKKLSFPKPKVEPVAETTPTDEPMSIDEAVKFAISMAPTINENAARRSKEMSSFDDYKEGSATESFEAQVREAAKFSKNWPKERSGEFFRLLNTYARRLAQYINRDNEIGTRVPSVLIAGPSNFPVRQKEKQVAAWDKNQEFYNEKVAPVLSKLEYPSRQGIKSSDSDALQKLKDKLERMERNQELMKRTNADFTKAVKEKKTVGEFLQQVSYLSDEMKKEAMYGIKSWHGKPFPPFQLQNANQEMRRLKQRIAEISKIKEAGDGEAENLENKHFGVERDTDLMRYKLTFDGIPAPEIRSVIKKYGARWSPRNMAWLVNLNRNGEYSIKRMIEELDKM